MNLDGDYLRRHYGELSDDALLDINPDDLTDLARQFYQVELEHRRLKRPTAAPTPVEEPEPNPPNLFFPIEGLPWKKDAATAAEYNDPEDAQQARDVLEQAAVPCALAFNESRWRFALMVPNNLLDKAQQILRTEIDEPENYADHFVHFSHGELMDLDVDHLPDIGREYYAAELRSRGLYRNIPAGTRHKSAFTTDGYVPVATLLRTEAGIAKRVLEVASISCRLEPHGSQGGFDSCIILVPQSNFDQASEILDQRFDDILDEAQSDADSADIHRR